MKKRVAAASAAPKVRKRRGRFGEVMHRLSKNTPAMIALCFVVLLILSAVFAPLLAPYDYAKQSLGDKFLMPSLTHPLGTDNFGRDILSRLLVGGRISLLVSVMAVAISVSGALIIGAAVGYFGGLLDSIIMRILDVFMAIPGMLLTIVFAVALGDTLVDTALAIALTSIPALARQLRASTLLIRDEEYIEAAKSFGSSHWRIIWKHVIPNTLAPVIVQISMRLGEAILAISGMSILGLGVQPPTPEWGNILASGQKYIRTFWPLITFPGILIGLAMLAFNLLGDGLRDAMDPRLKR